MSTARSGVTLELSTAYVREIFKNLESGDGKGLFDHVSDDVDWIVEAEDCTRGFLNRAEAIDRGVEPPDMVFNNR